MCLTNPNNSSTRNWHMNKLISTLMSTNAGYGITLLRIVTGLTFLPVLALGPIAEGLI